MRSRALRALWALAALLAASQAAAQVYPERPVRIIVPFAAGGSNDVIARILAQRLSDRLGQQFVVEHRPGAGGNTGADFVAKSQPDGHTLLLTAPGPLVVNPTLYAQLPFDAARDFAPVALVAAVPIVLMVHPGVPARDVKDLIALARSEPGKYSFASSGIGATNHLAGELLKNMAGINLVHVPYRGAAPAMNDLLGGHIPMMFDNMPGSLPQITSGKVRALAVAGAERAAVLPDVPTVAESALPGFEASTWFGLVAPGQTPAPVVERLTEAVRAALRAPDVIERFRDLGAAPGTAFGPEFGGYLKAETSKWADVIRKSGARAE
jgi:tripartite-type tricarboxylate transporter receptor subunit TctC